MMLHQQLLANKIQLLKFITFIIMFLLLIKLIDENHKIDFLRKKIPVIMKSGSLGTTAKMKLKKLGRRKKAPSHFASLVDSKKLKRTLKIAEKEELNILLWDHPPFGLNRFPRYTKAKQCGKCLVTLEKRKINDRNTKAVVFYFNTVSLAKVPQNRRPDQLYVWTTRESSPALLQLRNLTLKQFDHFFNITGTPRRDSGLYTPYGTAENIWNYVHRYGSGDAQEDIDFIISNKTNLAIWVVSNCRSTKGAVKRQIVVKKLVSAGLKVDLRGGCFSKRLESLDLIKRYKFYLSFENGYHCKDYITEKLFRNGYMMGAIPVVWGSTKSDYEALAPPHSYIHTDDFKTASDLVKYLNYLDKNDTAYREYFQWRKRKVTEMPQYGRTTNECQLCRIIHGINVDNIYHPNYEELKSYIPLFGYPNRSRVVPSLWKWFYGTENPKCFQQQSNNVKKYLKTFGLV